MKPDKNTFIILSPGFPANEADTTCLPAQQLFVQNLRENFPSLNIIVLAFQYPFNKSEYKWKGVQVISFNGRNRGGLKRLHTWYMVRRKLASLQRTHSIAGLFSFWCTECALVGERFAQKHQLKHFTWILGQDARKSNKFVRIIKPASGSLVAMSDFLADEFERNHFIRPQQVIPNGIDQRMYAQVAEPRSIDVLGAGSLIPLKQYDVFIDLIAQAKKKFPAIRSVIAGDGPERARLQAVIRRTGTSDEGRSMSESAGSWNRHEPEQQHRRTPPSDDVELIGEKPHSEVLRLMQKSKIFLHTSSYEGFSTVCLEALYAGAHVISFCNPVYEKIPHWYVVRNKEEMLRKLIELLSADLNHEPVIPFSMSDTAKRVMQLF
jgi:glycosyltransferase involved in cell wall biosynthesis